MSDLSPGAISTFLSTLRTLPIWQLGGLAFAGYVVLFVPPFGGIDPTLFRTQWGVPVWIGTLIFSVLTVARGLDSAITAYGAHRARVEARRAFRLVPRHRQRWWHLAKQQDNSYVSQITLDIEVANLTNHPVRIVKVSLLRPKPKGDLLHAEAILPAISSPYHNARDDAVPPHDTATASLHLMLRGTLAPQGKPIFATIGVTDQFGEEYRLKRVRIPSNDPTLPKPPMRDRAVSWLRASLPFRRRVATPEGEPLPAEWQHAGKFEEADLILNEEKRNYAAIGRERGGLGSLNVGLQSEPSFGVTIGGAVPSLLWDDAQARLIESPNAARLLRLHAGLDDIGKGGIERYLLSHLHRQSPYVSVGYFVFLVLHRLGRTVDALRAARDRLAGDKFYGYSNVLGTLSALVSREHFAIDPELYPKILEALAGDTEHNFRLPEKINLARLQQLDRKSVPQQRQDAARAISESEKSESSSR